MMLSNKFILTFLVISLTEATGYQELDEGYNSFRNIDHPSTDSSLAYATTTNDDYDFVSATIFEEENAVSKNTINDKGHHSGKRSYENTIYLPNEKDIDDFVDNYDSADNDDTTNYGDVRSFNEYRPRSNKFVWRGRETTWSVTDFNGVPNIDGDIVFDVAVSEVCTMSLSWTLDGSNPSFCDDCQTQLYYGIDGIFCTGVANGVIASQISGNSSVTFTAPRLPGIYAFRQFYSLSFDYIACGPHGRDEFAFIKVVTTSPTNAPTSNPSIQPTSDPSNSLAPTNYPSNAPTLSARPSIQPSLSPLPTYEIWGRRMTWLIVNFNGQQNTNRISTFTVLPGQDVNMTVYWTMDGENQTNQTYCPTCIMQLYYGIDDVFCTGVLSSVLNSQKEGRSFSTFTAPTQPGTYFFRQYISISTDFINCGSHGRNKTATLQINVQPTLNPSSEPSIQPSMSHTPSIEPTLTPSAFPSTSPTLGTKSPSAKPSFMPSNSLAPTNYPSNAPTYHIPPSNPINNSFPCAEIKVFRSMLYLNVTGNPDRAFDESDYLEDAVKLAYERALNSLCTFRSIEKVHLTAINVANGSVIDVPTNTNEISRFLNNVTEISSDDYPNWSAHILIEISCAACPDNAQLFANDAFRRGRSRILQRIEGACYCDSDLIEEGEFLDGIGTNIAPTKDEFLEELNDIVKENENITSVIEAVDVNAVTELIGPQQCLAVSLVCSSFEDGEKFSDSNDDSCYDIKTISNKELFCDGGKPLELGWIYRAASCAISNTNQESFSCQDYFDDDFFPTSKVFIRIQSFIADEEFSNEIETIFKGVVIPGDEINLDLFELTAKSGGTVKVEIRTDDDNNIDVEDDEEGYDDRYLIQSMIINTTCAANQDLTIGKSFGSLQLASYTYSGLKVEGFKRLFFTYIIQNISPSEKDIVSLAFDLNGENDILTDTKEKETLQSREVMIDKVKHLLPVFNTSSNFASINVVATGAEGQVCREDNNVLVSVQEAAGSTPPIFDPTPAPVIFTVAPFDLTSAPVTFAPVTASLSSEVCESIPSNGCSVCGEGKFVLSQEAIFAFPGQPVVPCGLLETLGLEGTIPLNQCGFLPSLIEEICRCTDCSSGTN